MYIACYSFGDNVEWYLLVSQWGQSFKSRIWMCIYDFRYLKNYSKSVQDKKVVHNFEWLKKALFCQLMPVKFAWKSADKAPFF